MENEKWGVGNAAKDKAFDTVKLGNDTVELIRGEHPHSKRDNNIYARTKGGSIYAFEGHKLPFKIVIEENNYLKTSELSGDEIRKTCTGKLFLNDKQIYECTLRNYDSVFQNIHNWILDMEMNWDWYPNKIDQQIGKIIGYSEQLFKIERFVIDQACMILVTPDGKPRKKFLWEDLEDGDDINEPLKVEITNHNICWYPR